jgi:diguanylate cyclase (GGDEF)-like protein
LAASHIGRLNGMRRLVLVLCVLVLTGSAGFAYLRSKTAHLLKLDAITVASDWSQYLVRTTPEFLLILAGELPSRSTLAAYRHAERLSRVRAFEIYDRRGALRMAFVDGQPLEGVATTTVPLATLAGSQSAPLVAMEAGAGDLAQVTLPLKVAGHVVGYLVTSVDQNGLKSTYLSEALQTAISVAVLLLLVGIVVHAGLGFQQRKSAAQIRYLARNDPLTGLPNRQAFIESLDDILARDAAQERETAVMLVDLDHFMQVNDALGQEGGDHVLSAVAQRLATGCNGGVVARLGGDTFGIIISSDAATVEAERVGGRILELLSQTVEWKNQRVQPLSSVGAVVSPTDGRETSQLMRRADIARYAAKAAGGNRMHFFNDRMGRHYEDRLLLQRTIDAAVAAQSFRLEYQPIIDLRSGRVSGFEALIRMAGPKGEEISPAIFIPAAERTGAIAAIGRWTLMHACRFAADWPQDLQIAVNLSPVQFESDAIIGEIRAALAESGLRAGRLEIEVTEGVLLRDSPVIRERLRALQELGVRVVLDDFGTGYSSLGYLWQFPFDKLKIDQSFIRAIDRNPRARGVLRTIIALGRTLGLPVTAEGIETENEAAFVKKLRCDQAQGYLFSRPLPETEVANFIMQAVWSKAQEPAAAATVRTRTQAVGIGQ